MTRNELHNQQANHKLTIDFTNKKTELLQKLKLILETKSPPKSICHKTFFRRHFLEGNDRLNQ